MKNLKSENFRFLGLLGRLIVFIGNYSNASSLIIKIIIITSSKGDEIPEHDIDNPLTEGFPWDDLRKILHGGQRLAKVQNGEEILQKVSTA